MNRSMHLRERTLKPREKLDCMQTMGGGGSEGTEGIICHQYISSLLCALL